MMWVNDGEHVRPVNSMSMSPLPHFFSCKRECLGFRGNAFLTEAIEQTLPLSMHGRVQYNQPATRWLADHPEE
uniref:Uncharacterized protein n=1 Tax=Astyanax mexicanus TaxID=7994 RepID=A0A3B1K005_ASTMX